MSMILAIDDEKALHTGLRFGLEDHEMLFAASGKEGLDVLATHPEVELVLLDLRMPPTLGSDEWREGLETLARIRESRPNLPVVMMSSYGDIDIVVEAIKLGAFHYLTKPLDISRLRAEVARALESSALKRENEALKESLRLRDSLALAEAAGEPNARGRAQKRRPGQMNDAGFGALVGRSEPMQTLHNWIERVAATAVPVLIFGESGSGKELVAREIHQRSARSAGPFVPVNTAAIPRELLESEMFGHKKGSFTGAVDDRAGCFEMADGGTIFLDEIGDMPPELQPKLLRALQEREVRRVGETRGRPLDFRVISATHRNLRDMTASGQFREDLYFRLNVLPLRVPPLRERLEDLPLLCEAILKRMGGGATIEKSALERLERHSWPGNVRELENVLQRASILSGEGEIGADVVEIALTGGDTLDGTLARAGRAAPIPGSGSVAAPEGPDVYADLLNRVKSGAIRVTDFKTFTDQYGQDGLRRVLEWAVFNSRDYEMAMTRLGYEGTAESFRQRVKRFGLARPK